MDEENVVQGCRALVYERYSRSSFPVDYHHAVIDTPYRRCSTAGNAERRSQHVDNSAIVCEYL
jgi:hypothetical protein